MKSKNGTQAELVDLLKQMTFIVESVAHLQGKERMLLPLCEKARAAIERIETKEAVQ